MLREACHCYYYATLRAISYADAEEAIITKTLRHIITDIIIIITPR
jgi:hypothetical protein